MKHPIQSLWVACVASLMLVGLSAIQTARASVNPAQPVIPNTIFDVNNYGAAGDGVTADTKAIQAAINAAGAAGGGIVEIPAGIYLCGPLQPASQINLRVDKGATLRMLPLNQYPGGIKDPKDFISGENLHDVAISGMGTIDGQGADWWHLAQTAQNAKRPRMIHFGKSDRILERSVHQIGRGVAVDGGKGHRAGGRWIGVIGRRAGVLHAIPIISISELRDAAALGIDRVAIVVFQPGVVGDGLISRRCGRDAATKGNQGEGSDKVL